MKAIRITLLFLVCLANTTQVHAQDFVEPFDATILFDNAMRPCTQANLDPESKSLKKAWSTYLNDNYNVNLKGIGFFSNKDLLSAEEVLVNQISSKTIDLYTYIIEDDNGSEMKVFARLGYDVYISRENYPNEFAAIHEIVDSFIKYYLPKYYTGEINYTEKRVKDLAKERDAHLRKIEKKTKSIEKLRSELEEEEAEMLENKKLLEETEKKLIKRKEKLERVRTQLRKL